MSDATDRGTNYPRGFPNPEKIGFFPVSQLTGSGLDQTDAIKRTCELLNRPAIYTDTKGYEHEIVGAAVDEPGQRIAWVEGRSKSLRSDYMDVEFRLKARVSGTEQVDWKVETYNPYFGCQVGYINWWGDRVIVVYREKHATLVAVASLRGSIRLFPIHDDWELAKDVIYYVSDEPDLVEVLLLPEIERGLPVSADELPRLSDALRVALPSDLGMFQEDLRAAVFPGSAPSLESDLILGALGYRFWHRWPEAAPGYTTGRKPWNSPCWLPFYWYSTLGASGKRTFLSILDRAAGQTIPHDLAPASIASRYIAKRCATLATACRAERLPDKARCSFWVDWSVKAFATNIGLFPAGLRRAFEQLRPLASRWSPY